MRLGVDTGEVVAGQPGLAGGALLTTARLAGAAPAGTILVGARTADAARGLFEFGLPLAESPETGGTRLACRQLVRALSLMRTEGRGGLRSASWVARARASFSAPRTAGSCPSGGHASSRCWATRAWARRASCGSCGTSWPGRRPSPCAGPGGASPTAGARRTGRSRTSCASSSGSPRPSQPETVRRRLAGREILALTLGVAAGSDLHPLTARERLHSAWAELLTELTAERPVVVLVEDLHWAHEPLLDLLDRLLDEVQGPLLVVATARPELVAAWPSWGRRRDAVTVWLEPLSEPEAEALLDGLGLDDLPEPVRRRVLDMAEGNPFFLEELLAGLHDRALATPESDVPDSVQAVLATRIDLLPPVEKAALQAAAVMGRVFWRGAVRELLEGESPDFAVLEARDFIRRRSGPSLVGEREFAFKHALTREVAYASVPRAAAGAAPRPLRRLGRASRRRPRRARALPRAPLRGGGAAAGRRSRVGRPA